MAENEANSYLDEMVNEDFYIAPDTEMLILRGVPLDNTYEHTIAWENLDYQRTKQRDYFVTKAKIRVLKQSYQRVDREWFKVYISADELYDCNYIMFRNTAFNPNKWWYAFILEVEYINNNTAKIRYEIDVMQTWLPGLNMDYQMLPCFVERCHSKSDELYENLIPESVVNTDQYVVDNVTEFDMSQLSVICLVSEALDGTDWWGNPDFTSFDGKVRYGTYGKVGVVVAKVTDENGKPYNDVVEKLNDYLNQYINAGKENSVISIYMCPTKFADLTGIKAIRYRVNIQKPSPGQPLGGKSVYYPKNMKLYSSPFNVIRVSNQCGKTMTYAWELFDEANRGTFEIAGVPIWMPCVTIYPKKYRNLEDNFDESLSYDQFTICPWGSDAYAAWRAQNAGHMVTETAGGVASIVAAIIGAGVGGATANPMLVATGVGGAVSAATKILNSLYEAKHTPTTVHDPSNNSLILPSMRKIKFIISKESMKYEMLKLYDDYFTKYGYAQKSLMVPPLVNREHWTYVQTVGFEFNGEINDTDTKKIKSIFDNGITFWRNPNEIGHYELSNDPLL